MIRDRLTAKFLRAKPAKAVQSETAPKITPKEAKSPVMDTYTRDRRLSGSFWV